MNTKLKLGWIGTGVMGKSMCKHLLNNGYSLSVYNRTKSKADELILLGAEFLEPDQIAKNSDVVFLMLGFPRDVEEVAFKQILPNMKKNTFLVDHTTSSPQLAELIQKQALSQGIYSYDAPVSGGDIGARNGKLVTMVGGRSDNFDTVKEIMMSYSSKVELMGDAGKGQHTKMANQIIISSGMIAVVEGLIYAYKAGLNCEDMINLISEGAAGSFSLKVYGPRILKRDFEPGFYIEHFVKDLEIALKESKQMGLKLKGLELAYEFYNQMIKEGYGKKGTQALQLALEKMNNINI